MKTAAYVFGVLGLLTLGIQPVEAERRGHLVTVTVPAGWSSVEYQLILHESGRSMVTLRGDRVLWAGAFEEWLVVRWDAEQNFVALAFAGGERPERPGRVTIRGENCDYFLNVVVTETMEASEGFLQFRRELSQQAATGVQNQPATGFTEDELETDILSGRVAVVGRSSTASHEALSVHLQLAAGVLWSANSVVTGEREPAPMAGVGVAVRKPVTSLLAVDSEALIAKSGEARFRGVSWDGSLGDLSQTATLVRLDIGARLRTGRRMIPTLRFGAGLEGAWSRFSYFDGSSARFGPDDELSWTLLLSVSGGLDIAIGSHALAGFAVSATAGRSVAGRLHVGIRP